MYPRDGQEACSCKSGCCGFGDRCVNRYVDVQVFQVIGLQGTADVIS